ncbi:MAG: hypothetical protein J6Y29_06565 [Clostridiales bacterium]|nr:hypothetical protein [Clostridiales bacterium]
MNIIKLQKYKNVRKILTGMLAVTLSVGMITSFSWAEEVNPGNNSGLMMTALDDSNSIYDHPSLDLDDYMGSQEGVAEGTEKRMILWKYKDTDENCVYIGLKHPGLTNYDKEYYGEDKKVFLDEIEDEKENTRVKFIKNTTEAIARYELKDGDKKFKVKDTLGNYQWINIDEIKLEVTRAYKNEDGDVMAVAMKCNGSTITKVTYMDKSNTAEVIAQGNEIDTTNKVKRYTIEPGTTSILVYVEDEATPCEVQLLLDWKEPEIERVYKNDNSKKIILKAKDNESGIEQVIIDGKNVSITTTQRNIFELYDKKITELKLIDAVGHENVVSVNEDKTGPSVKVRKVKEDGKVVPGKYEIIIQDFQSGLGELLIKSGDTEAVTLKGYKFTDLKEGEERELAYPQDEKSYTMDIISGKFGEVIDGEVNNEETKTGLNIATDESQLDTIIGVSKICVSDALGNVAELDLSNIHCVIIYTYSNEDGSKVAIKLYEDGQENTIKNIEIVNSSGEVKMVERFKEEGVSELARCYETPKGTVGIRVNYTFEKGDDGLLKIQPAKFTLVPYIEEPTVDGNKVWSLVGINRIDYSDGRRVEFNEYMPRTVELQFKEEDGAMATVYDALDNQCVVKK